MSLIRQLFRLSGASQWRPLTAPSGSDLSTAASDGTLVASPSDALTDLKGFSLSTAHSRLDFLAGPGLSGDHMPMRHGAHHVAAPRVRAVSLNAGEDADMCLWLVVPRDRRAPAGQIRQQPVDAA